MGMLDSIMGGASAPAAVVQVVQAPTPAVVQAPAVVQPPTAPQRMKIVDFPAGAIEAKDAIQGQQYIVNGVRCMFLCGTNGDQQSFIPLAGGQPQLVGREHPVLPAAVADAQPAAPAPAPAAQALPLVQPPDAPKSNPALAAKPPPPDAPPAVVAKAIADGVIKTEAPAAPAPVVVQPAPAAAPEAPAAAAPAEPAAPKRTRAKKADSDSAPAPAAQQVATTPTPSTDASGIHLYFGCSPIGVAAQHLGGYVDALERECLAAAQQNVPDIRMCADSTFGFGKWRGFMAKAARERLPAPGRYIVTRGDERIECVAESLAAILPPGHVTIGG